MALSEDEKATLSAYLDGELGEADSQEVEARLNIDPEVRAEFETLRETWSLLDYLPQTAPKPDFTNRTLERLSREGQAAPRGKFMRRMPAALLWAAGVLLAVGLGYGASGLLPTAVPVPANQDFTEADEALQRHLRVIEMWPLYQNAEDVDFIRKLDDPELFGDEPGS